MALLIVGETDLVYDDRTDLVLAQLRSLFGKHQAVNSVYNNRLAQNFDIFEASPSNYFARGHQT
jgi:hypothetical protein